MFQLVLRGGQREGVVGPRGRIRVVANARKDQFVPDEHAWHSLVANIDRRTFLASMHFSWAKTGGTPQNGRRFVHYPQNPIPNFGTHQVKQNG